ncbi:MAG: hypothetical protein E7173_03400 [Firmicutes bacterium]|nr:hypothetical protein [Bacillota bacterium]
MELEILKLIYYYSVNGKLVDSKFIDKIIEIVVNKKNLDSYVRNVRFTSQLDKNDYGVTCAAYSPLSMEVLIDYESIKIVMENRSSYDCLFHSLEQIMFRNLTITQIILHELEHAYQNKQADSKADSSIEVKLIKASLFLEQAMKNPKFLAAVLKGEIISQDFLTYILQNRELYKQYYALNPTERLAQINSFRAILTSIEPIKKHIPNLYEFQNASLVEEMLRGYQDSWNEGICPTQVYLFGTRQSKVWLDFDFYNQDSKQLIKTVSEQNNLARRLSLGLPVTYEEYEKTHDWLQTTNKYSI